MNSTERARLNTAIEKYCQQVEVLRKLRDCNVAKECYLEQRVTYYAYAAYFSGLMDESLEPNVVKCLNDVVLYVSASLTYRIAFENYLDSLVGKYGVRGAWLMYRLDQFWSFLWHNPYSSCFYVGAELATGLYEFMHIGAARDIFQNELGVPLDLAVMRARPV